MANSCKCGNELRFPYSALVAEQLLASQEDLEFHGVIVPAFKIVNLELKHVK
jgi:hypothetical protein